ncbi:hypothetical protein D3C72_491520 [compost metagenome]
MGTTTGASGAWVFSRSAPRRGGAAWRTPKRGETGKLRSETIARSPLPSFGPMGVTGSSKPPSALTVVPALVPDSSTKSTRAPGAGGWVMPTMTKSAPGSTLSGDSRKS